ncbi:MAG TPA: hypothetical protein VGF97_00170 [Rhizomicrobium sp.]|jgi:phosphatidylglycerophosphate synthase
MKRPGIHIYLFGNLFSAFVFLVAAIYLCYSAWQGETSPIIAVAAIFALMASAKARERLEAYNERKREWQAMSGEAPTAGRTFVTQQAPRVIAGMIIWFVLACVALGVGNQSGSPVAAGNGPGAPLAAANQPNIQIVAAWLFWLATALLVVGGIYRFIKRNRTQRPKPIRDVPVAICLPVPRQSDAAAHAFAALPKYCSDILQIHR